MQTDFTMTRNILARKGMAEAIAVYKNLNNIEKMSRECLVSVLENSWGHQVKICMQKSLLEGVADAKGFTWVLKASGKSIKGY